MAGIVAEEREKAPKSMAPALIAVHPDDSSVVVAVGAALRIFQLVKQVPVEVKDGTSPEGHGNTIRAMAFDLRGSLFASVGDDKRVKLWDATTWGCIKTICLTKKVSAVAFSHDSAWLMVADKFGIVYVLPTAPDHTADEPIPILAHCCSIITGLGCSPSGKYLVTSDRDFKIRVTMFPKRPLEGAHEIHSYCLGHTNFVSCIAFVGAQGLLISGGGDTSLRLWEYETGTLLDTFDTVEAGVGNQSNTSSAVVGLAVSCSTSLVAATMERLEGVLLLTCNVVEKQLCLLQKLVWSGHAPPTSLAFDTTGNLWLVSGAAETVEMGDEAITAEAVAAAQRQAQAIAAAAVTRIWVVKNCLLVDDSDVPGGELLLSTLQGHPADAAALAAVAAATEAAELAMKNLLSKRQYTVEQREQRKRLRNDKKLTIVSP